MSVDQRERSRYQAEPVELYLFRYGEPGSEVRYAYTDSEFPVTITQPRSDGQGAEEVTYEPWPISRSSITASGSLDKAPLEVRTTFDCPVAELLGGFRVSYIVLLTIRQGHFADPANEWLVAWTGRALACSLEGAEAVLTCEPTSTSMRRIGLRRHWQYGCPHWLYGPECRASRAAATKTAQVVKTLGSAVQVYGGFTDRPLEKYLGGLASWSVDGTVSLRTIIRVTPLADGTIEFVLGSPPDNLNPGAALDLALGCNHTMNDCQSLHVPVDEPATAGGNIHNYGGQPFIPGKNPIGIVNQYY